MALKTGFILNSSKVMAKIVTGIECFIEKQGNRKTLTSIGSF